MNAAQKRTLAIGVIIIVVAAALAAWKFLPLQRADQTEDVSRPQGTLYLTLYSIANDRLRLRTYSFTDGLLRTIGGHETELTASVGPDGHTMAFVRYQDQSSGSYLQIFTQEIAPQGEAALPNQITSSKTYLKRLPDWAPDGTRIAFMAQAASTTLSYNPNDWTVYVTDLEGNEQKIANGEYPKWSADGKKLVFLRDDGLYLYNTASTSAKALKKLWDGKVSTSMKLSINPLRDTVAWSHFHGREISLFKIDFQNETAQGYKHIQSPAFWTAFSPNNEYLAVQEASDDLTRGWLTVYEIATGKGEIVRDLAAFDQSKMFLTDWK